MEEIKTDKPEDLMTPKYPEERAAPIDELPVVAPKQLKLPLDQIDEVSVTSISPSIESVDFEVTESPALSVDQDIVISKIDETKSEFPVHDKDEEIQVPTHEIKDIKEPTAKIEEETSEAERAEEIKQDMEIPIMISESVKDKIIKTEVIEEDHDLYKTDTLKQKLEPSKVFEITEDAEDISVPIIEESLDIPEEEIEKETTLTEETPIIIELDIGKPDEELTSTTEITESTVITVIDTEEHLQDIVDEKEWELVKETEISETQPDQAVREEAIGEEEIPVVIDLHVQQPTAKVTTKTEITESTIVTKDIGTSEQMPDIVDKEIERIEDQPEEKALLKEITPIVIDIEAEQPVISAETRTEIAESTIEPEIIEITEELPVPDIVHQKELELTKEIERFEKQPDEEGLPEEIGPVIIDLEIQQPTDTFETKTEITESVIETEVIDTEKQLPEQLHEKEVEVYKVSSIELIPSKATEIDREAPVAEVLVDLDISAKTTDVTETETVEVITEVEPVPDFKEEKADDTVKMDEEEKPVQKESTEDTSEVAVIPKFSDTLDKRSAETIEIPQEVTIGAPEIPDFKESDTGIFDLLDITWLISRLMLAFAN